MIPIVIVVEALALLAACRLLARWRARALRHQLTMQTLRSQLKRQADEAIRTLAEAIATPQAAPAPAEPKAGRRAITVLSVQDACDLLLITEYARRRAEPGSVLGEAAGRVRLIGETAASDLGITPRLRRPGRAP